MFILALMTAVAAPTGGETIIAGDVDRLAIYGVGGEVGGPLYLQVHAGDLDGDSVPDDAILKLICADGKLQQSSFRTVARESASGMPTGKRQHAPVTFVKEWGAASPQLREIKPQYDVKSLNKRVIADGWADVALSAVEGLCPAAQAAVRATKTRSNIQNN